jgi:hypothetical protein
MKINKILQPAVRKRYYSPELQLIKLDSEISLAMESDPGYDENDEVNNQLHHPSDPWKSNLA